MIQQGVIERGVKAEVEVPGEAEGAEGDLGGEVGEELVAGEVFEAGVGGEVEGGHAGM
mgnify:CR=1 FL=1